MAKQQPASGETRSGRIAQIRAVYRMTKQSDRWLGLILFAWFLAIFAFFVVLGLVFDQPWFFFPLGVLAGLLASTIVFGRRAERAAFSQVEGKPGAAVGVLNALRRGWTVTPVVSAAPRTQDVVHRAVGRPGVVLIGEGSPNRVSQLLSAERRRLARLLGDIPIYELVVGNGEEQVPLKKLRNTMIRLPRNMSKDQVREINNRLRAIGDLQQQMMPKGPMPKNIRLPRGPKLG